MCVCCFACVYVCVCVCTHVRVCARACVCVLSKFQNPVTLCSGEIWGIFVRLVHGADPRSRLVRVSSASRVVYSTVWSYVFTHYTNLTSRRSDGNRSVTAALLGIVNFVVSAEEHDQKDTATEISQCSSHLFRHLLLNGVLHCVIYGMVFILLVWMMR